MRTEGNTKPRLTEEAKTRVPSEHKEALAAIAETRHLDLSDILREAIREYLESPAQKAVLEAREQKSLFPV